MLEKRVSALRHEIRSRTSSHGAEVEAYIVTSFDEHQNHQLDDSESRLQFISGFSGPVGDAVVIFLARMTLKNFFVHATLIAIY